MKSESRCTKKMPVASMVSGLMLLLNIRELKRRRTVQPVVSFIPVWTEITCPLTGSGCRMRVLLMVCR